MNEMTFRVEHAPEGGFTARANPQSLSTTAENVEQLLDQGRAAVRSNVDVDARAQIICLHFIPR